MLPPIFSSVYPARLDDLPDGISRAFSAEASLRRIVLPEGVGRHAEYLVGMLAGGFAFRGVSGLFAARNVMQGIRWWQRGVAILAETTAFTAAAQGVRHFCVSPGRPEVSPGQEWLSNLMLVLPFHLANAAGPSLARRVADRLIEMPADRRALLPTVTWHVTQQMMLLGAILSQQAEEDIGLRARRPYPELAWEGVLRLLEYNLAERGLDRALR